MTCYHIRNMQRTQPRSCKGAWQLGCPHKICLFEYTQFTHRNIDISPSREHCLGRNAAVGFIWGIFSSEDASEACRLDPCLP